MPWTNLAIQRKRIRFLEDCFPNSTVHSNATTDYSNFSVRTKTVVTRQQMDRLHKEGFEIKGIVWLANEAFMIYVYCNYVLEKQSPDIQEVAHELGNKNIHALNEELLNRREKWYDKEIERLKGIIWEERSKTHKMNETIKILAQRILRIRGLVQ